MTTISGLHKCPEHDDCMCLHFNDEACYHLNPAQQHWLAARLAMEHGRTLSTLPGRL